MVSAARPRRRARASYSETPTRVRMSVRAARRRQAREADAVFYDSVTSVTKGSKALQRKAERAFGYGSSPVIKPPVNYWALSNWALMNTWHQRCCRVKAEVVTGAEMMVQRRDKRDDPDEGNQFEREYLSRLVRRANDAGESLQQVLEKVQYDFEDNGRGYIEVVRDLLGRPRELYHVRAVSMRRGWDDDQQSARGFWQLDPRDMSRKRFFRDFGAEDQWNLGDDGKPTTDAAKVATELIELGRYTATDDYYPLPDWLTCLVGMEGTRAAQIGNRDHFRHRNMPAAIVLLRGLDKNDKEDAIEEVEDFFTSVQEGRESRAMVLAADPGDPDLAPEQAGVEVHPVESPRDASHRDYQADNRDEVLAAHGVPPSLAGIRSAGRLGGKGSDDADRRDFKRMSIDPRQRRLEHALNERVIADPEHGLGIEGWVIRLGDFDLSDATTSVAKRAEDRKQVAAGLMTINEARLESGREKLRDTPQADEALILGAGGIPMPVKDIGKLATEDAGALGATAGTAARPSRADLGDPPATGAAA